MHVLDRSMHTAYNKACCCPVLPSQKHRCWQTHSSYCGVPLSFLTACKVLSALLWTVPGM